MNLQKEEGGSGGWCKAVAIVPDDQADPFQLDWQAFCIHREHDIPLMAGGLALPLVPTQNPRRAANPPVRPNLLLFLLFTYHPLRFR